MRPAATREPWRVIVRCAEDIRSEMTVTMVYLLFLLAARDELGQVLTGRGGGGLTVRGEQQVHLLGRRLRKRG